MDAYADIGDALASLPDHVSLPVVERRPTTCSKSPAEVRNAGDLPQRMFMGNLDSAAVRLTESGWVALYRDHNPGTWFELKYERQSATFFFRQSWNGHECNGGCQATTFNDLIGWACGMVLPWELDQKARMDVESRFNAKYIGDTEVRPISAYFPDGRIKSIIYPIPVTRMRDALAFHEKLEHSAEIKTSIRGFFVKGWSAVNYVEGDIPNFIESPLHLFTHTIEQLGLPAVEMPVWETSSGRPSAWTLRRLHYLHIVQVSFRDLLRALTTLCKFGLIGPASTDKREGFPHAHEFRALILPAGLEVSASQIQDFSRDRLRRTFYPQICTASQMQELLQENSPREVSESGITRIEHVSRQAQEWIHALIEDISKQVLSGH